MTASFLPQRRSTSSALAASASLFAALASGIAGNLPAQAGPPAAVADANRLLASGRSYRATRLLLSQPTTPSGIGPEHSLLAARSASDWSGWGTVVRLLEKESWLDSYEGGAGRALLARARVERSEDAVADARAAVSGAPEEELGPRLVTLARAFDRAGLLDSAARAYRQAAARFPSIGDWLLLRAAGVLADSAERAALYREVSLPAAVPRIRWTEALALERTGNPIGAAGVYQSLGATLSSLKLRLGAAADSASRTGLRGGFLAALALAPDDARAAIDILDREYAPLTRSEELAIARRAATADRLTRAAAGFARAAPLADADRFTYGTVLARLGRHREAIGVFESVKARELLARSRYQRARSLLRVRTREAGMVALRQVLDAPNEDSVTAATAGFHRADLLVDSGDDGAARSAYLEVAQKFPRTSHGSRAAFQAALILYVQGDFRGAEREFSALAARPGDRTESSAAVYWSGRALDAAGDSVGARARWQSVIERFPQSYYAVPAATRLSVAPIAVTGDSLAPPDDAVHAALTRGALLERHGLRVEAKFEYDRISRSIEAGPAAVLSATSALSAGGCTARAYRMASRVQEAVPQRLLFPLPNPPGFLEEAREAEIDPLLAAALIRQESGFEPTARSAADARGLMQVLPTVGAALARADGLKDWDSALLYQPEINIRFGLRHLAMSLRRFPTLESALAGYNAGTRASLGWLELPGARQDPEIFMERIGFTETRDYVRRILRNLAVYRALYPRIS